MVLLDVRVTPVKLGPVVSTVTEDELVVEVTALALLPAMSLIPPMLKVVAPCVSLAPTVRVAV